MKLDLSQKINADQITINKIIVLKNHCKNVNCFILLILILAPVLSTAQEKPRGKEWKVPEKEAKKKSEIKADADAIKNGKDIWAQNCKSCHGPKGLGDGAPFWKTTTGRKPMPAYNEKLSDTERWQLVAFMRTLGNPVPVVKPAAINKNTKDAGIQEKDTEPVKKDTAATHSIPNKTNPDNIVKIDSSKTLSPEYLELKNEIEILRKEIKAISNKVDSLKEGKQKQ